MSTGEVTIGLISAPGTAAEIAVTLADDLHAELSRHLPTVRWRVPSVVDALVHPPTDDAALVAAARDRLLTEDWDLVVCLTDLPLKARRRPVVAHASPLRTGWLSCASRRSVPSGCVDAPVTRSSGWCAPCSGTPRTTSSWVVQEASDAAPENWEEVSSRVRTTA
jgi:hypothetical protein